MASTAIYFTGGALAYTLDTTDETVIVDAYDSHVGCDNVFLPDSDREKATAVVVLIEDGETAPERFGELEDPTIMAYLRLWEQVRRIGVVLVPEFMVTDRDEHRLPGVPEDQSFDFGTYTLTTREERDSLVIELLQKCVDHVRAECTVPGPYRVTVVDYTDDSDGDEREYQIVTIDD